MSEFLSLHKIIIISKGWLRDLIKFPTLTLHVVQPLSEFTGNFPLIDSIESESNTEVVPQMKHLKCIS